MPEVLESKENIVCKEENNSVNIAPELLFDLLREAESANRALLAAQKALRNALQTQAVLIERLKIEKLKT